MKKRQFEAETKVAIELEGLRGETSIAEICRKYEISEALYYKSPPAYSPELNPVERLWK